MKILFDLSATQPSPDSKYHGGSDYTKFIFFEAMNRKLVFDVCYDKNFSLHKEIQEVIQKNIFKVYEFENTKDLERYINDSNYDKFFSGIPYGYYDFKIPNTKFIMSILGLRTIELSNFKEQIPYTDSILKKTRLFLYQYLVKKRIDSNIYKSFQKLLEIPNKHILTISNHSLYSILNFFPSINENEISLCYAPMNFNKDLAKSHKNNNYILMVSGNRWIKNNLRAIRAIDQLISQNKIKEYKIIVLGCEGIDFSRRIKNKDHFIFEDYVSNESLETYYANAKLFVYPTLNEGFGYPPVKCMNYGIPIIASGTSSVPEVCADAALYFNPYSESEIKNRILNVLLNEETRLELIQKGNKRVKQLKTMQDIMITKTINIIFQ